MKIRQFVPAVYPRDAVGGHVLRLDEQLRRRGHDAQIVVESHHPETRDRTVGVDALPPDPDAGVNVFHVATGTVLADVVTHRSEPLVLVHHDLTPIDQVAAWDAELVVALALARRQFEALAKRATLGIGDSEHNRRELVRAGCRQTTTAPLVFDLPEAVETSRTDPPTVLFVGRFAPNKGHEHLIAAIRLLRRRMPDVVLRCIGGSSVPEYRRSLDRLVEHEGLGDAVRFDDAISDDDLRQAYATASVFCCVSAHEGFGMPLIEAMHHGLPVVAWDAAAVGETVGTGGIVLLDRETTTVATALERVLSDDDLAARLVVAGRARAEQFGVDRAVDRFVAALGGLEQPADDTGPTDDPMVEETAP